MANEGFSIVNLERSTRLHALMRDLVDRIGSETPPHANIRVSANGKDFSQRLARSRLFNNCSTKLEQAYQFAMGTTAGIGGDKFQRFMASNLHWSPLVHRLKTHTAKAATLEDYAKLFQEMFSIELTGVLLPIHSTLEGFALLLFLWLEDDLAPSSTTIQKVYLACLVRLNDSNRVLAGICTALTAEAPAPQPALCELLPRSWLLAEAPSRSSVSLANEMALTYHQVSAFGTQATFHLVSHAIVDGSLFTSIDAEVDAIDREREAVAAKAKKKGKKKKHGK
jgi:hypothetical protein